MTTDLVLRGSGTVLKRAKEGAAQAKQYVEPQARLKAQQAKNLAEQKAQEQSKPNP